jgi:hypothetical protein
MPKNQASKPHDEFFKATFGRLDIALDYLQQMLPEDIQHHLNLFSNFHSCIFFQKC